jgi:uncharacterized protein (TIGR02996 family)
VDPAVSYAAQYFCDQPKTGAYDLTLHEAIDAVLDAGTAGQVYAAMKHGPKYHVQEFFRLARAARDPAALALIRRRFAELGWAETVLALDGTELVPELLEGVQARKTFNDSAPPLAAGYFGGVAVKPQLRALFDTMSFRPDRYALGIAIIGDPADLAFFKALSTVAEGPTAKRIHGALAKQKAKDRLAAVDALTKTVDSIAPLIALCKLISDDNAEIVEHAAIALRDYAVPRPEAGDAFHLIFLTRARAAIARGVTRTARIAMDELQQHIPRSEPFPAGPDVAAFAPRKAKGATLGAKARGLEMLETMREQLPVKPATQRDAALEAEIAADPDDVARYLVYADWLQQQNDARGFLILLHHAMHQQPGDKARAVAAQGFLEQHRYALLGRLEPFVRERDLATAELEWFMGFIRKAKLASPSAKLILDGLAYLLENPSAIFLQELVIDSHGGPLPIDPKRVVDMLLGAKQPQTLRMITIGKPGGWTVPKELEDAFPRLRRAPVIEWNEITAKIAEQRRIKHGLELANVPPPRSPHAIAVDLDALLVGLKCELDLDRPLGLLAAMRRLFDATSLDDFALALVRRWELQSQNPRWLFDVVGPLGGPQCARWLGERLMTFSHQRAVQAIMHLARIGSDAAVNELIALMLGGGGARQATASSALDIIAKQRGLADRDELLVTVSPDTADEATQRRWLEYVMLSGYRIPIELFRRHVLGNRVRLALARTLLWAECEGERVIEPFRVDDDTSYPARGSVGLVHPAELAPDELARFRAQLSAQAIRQLDRPVFTLSQQEAATTGLVKFATRRVGFYPLQGVFEHRGWTPITDDDDGHGLTSGWTRWFHRDQVVGRALLGAGNASISEVRMFGRDNQPRRFSAMHVVTLSELLWDLETAHGGTPQPSGVIVERARSNRSKCVICSEPIALDTVRIGVERLIETPAFTGRATVWMHPACASQAPELAGVDIAKLVES